MDLILPHLFHTWEYNKKPKKLGILSILRRTYEYGKSI